MKSLIKFHTIYFSNCSVLYDRKGLNKKKLEIDRFARYSKTERKINYTSFFIKEKFIYDTISNSMNEKSKFTNDIWTQMEENIKKEENNNEIEKKIKTEEGKMNKQIEKKNK